MNGRRSGVLVPLFSLRSSTSWGVGEFRDLTVFADWLRLAGQSFVQILPITEVPESETSPYSALTAMALDPLYLALPEIEDFVALGGESALPPADRATLDGLRRSNGVSYHVARELKDRWCRNAYDRFLTATAGRDDPRRAAFEDFIHTHADWLDDFALFQALRKFFSRQPWWQWPELYARRENAALAEAARKLDHELGYRKYLQWQAAMQWMDVRSRVRPLRIYGDVPFMISADSPDVWARQSEFRFDATIGVPPDAFSETGQDWGLPPWRWKAMAENRFGWMRQRARRTAQLFDGFRLDHLVGLYRIYVRPLDKAMPAFFAPPDQATQTIVGEALVSLYRATDADVIAEDLGIVPDFVRESLRRLGVPGFKVMRWERHYAIPGTPFIDPADYVDQSVATTGTHDTEPMASWWNALPAAEQSEILALPSVQRNRVDDGSALDAIIRALLQSPSRLTIFPLQDLFGWPDRINTPAQVNDQNWTWTLPWTVDRLLEVDEARDRAHALAQWTRAAKRG